MAVLISSSVRHSALNLLNIFRHWAVVAAEHTENKHHISKQESNHLKIRLFFLI
jgi:hypothetical protein